MTESTYWKSRISDVLIGLALAGALILLAGCAGGSAAKGPQIAVPATYRGAEPGEPPFTSLGDLHWEEVFQDEELQQLIRTALQQNHNVRIAAARITQAEAQLGIVRSDRYPRVHSLVHLSDQRTGRSGYPPLGGGLGGLNLSVAWEADFWGKFRSASEAGRANLLASEWGRHAVVSTLVADLAAAYYRLRALDLTLEISRHTLESRQESLELTRELAEHGLIAWLDVRQAEQLVFTAGSRIPEIERRIEQEENLISILTGHNPGPIPRGRVLTDQPHAPEVPAGLPSSLLDRRPDLRRAEQLLVSSNSRVAVAKAAFFPQITLTGVGGFQSSALSSLFSGPAGLWNLVGGLTQPIFAGGKIRSESHLAQAQQEEALLVYEQTVQQAFREVSDALVAYRKNQELRQQREQLTEAAQDAAELAGFRYRAGLTSYLEVLTNETNHFNAQLDLTQARLEELEAYVQLYRALGGGWRP